MNIFLILATLLAVVKPADPIQVDKPFWPKLIQERKSIREKLGREIDIVLIGSKARQRSRSIMLPA